MNSELTLERFSTWKVEALRLFLSKRGMSTDGNKAELAALCFAVSKMNIPIQPSAEEIIQQNKNDYDALLKLDGIAVPDPLTICDNWLDEKDGIMVWPPVFLSDIANFLMTDSRETASRYLNDYKIGKAYEYFSANWVKEIFFHSISKDSVYCFLRAKCTPSQKFGDSDHTVWTCIVKETGEIKSAYCSCTAGLGQTCNHIAGLLFRLESANKLGLSACTSLPCAWNVPKDTNIQPKLVSDIEIKKSRHGRAKSRPLVSKQRTTFEPLEHLNEIENLTDGLKKVLPNAVFCKGLETPVSDVSETVMIDREPVSVVMQDMVMDSIVTKLQDKSNVNSFIENQPKLSENDIKTINEATIGQSNNAHWKNIRQGRLTASNFYHIFTRVNTYKKNQQTDMTCLVSSVMGYTNPNPNLKSLKYGRESEPIAKNIYMHKYQKSHKNCLFNECGIFLDGENSYIGASPDLLVSCDCCGNGLLEIKSVMVSKCDNCFSFCRCNLPDFLYSSNNTINVKKNHSHFCQIQGQMALTRRNWCDLLVYSCNGCFIERVYFEKDYYNRVFENLQLFFAKFIAPELLSRKIEQTILANKSCEPVPMDIEFPTGTTFFCPLCNCQIKEQENIRSFKDRSVCCDVCDKWHHFKCVNMTKSALQKLVDWICPACTEHSS